MVAVSVIVPVFNMQDYLNVCLDSVLQQSLEQIEIICIDDGSTDNSAKILDEYHEQDARVKVIHQENRGVGATRNRGILEASGEFIAFMDPDDYYPDMDVLKDLYNAAIKHHVFIAGGSFCEDHNGKIVYNYPPALQDYIFKENRIMDYQEHQFDFGYIRFIYSRSFLVENDIFFPHYIRFQDPPFFVKAMITAKQFYAMKRFAYCYRWGHKKIDWNVRRTTDMVRGIVDNLEMSRKAQLPKLHRLSVSRLEDNGFDAICKNLSAKNLELFSLLLRANSLVDVELLKTEKDSVLSPYVLKPLKWLVEKDDSENTRKLTNELNRTKHDLENIQNSWSFRIGRFITAPLRWIRNLIKR